MINVSSDDITVVGSQDLKTLQLALLLQHYLNNDIDVINGAIELLSNNVDDVSFHDCFFRFGRSV